MSRQSGFSMIELLIASTIGLVLMAAVGQIFLSNKQSFTAQEAMGNIQENARLAMFFLQRDIRLAGYPRVGGPAAIRPGACPAVSACIGANVNNPSGVLGAGETCATAATAAAGIGSYDCGGGLSDQIEIYSRVDTNCANDTATNCVIATDCLGRRVPRAVITEATDPAYVANRYYVRIDPVTRARHLMCRSFSYNRETNLLVAEIDTQQPVVEGIESMQILYGVDTNADFAATPRVDPAFATRYVRADQITVLDDWSKIVSVRIGLLASSVGGSGSSLQDTLTAQRYLLLDAPIFSRTDALRRRTFVSTIELRNRTQ